MEFLHLILYKNIKRFILIFYLSTFLRRYSFMTKILSLPPTDAPGFITKKLLKFTIDN